MLWRKRRKPWTLTGCEARAGQHWLPHMQDFLGGFSGGRGIATTVQAALTKRKTPRRDSCLVGSWQRGHISANLSWRLPVTDNLSFSTRSNSDVKFSSKSRRGHEHTGSSESLWLCWLQKGEGRGEAAPGAAWTRWQEENCPSKQSWSPSCTEMVRLTRHHAKKKRNFMHLASKCWPLKWFSCQQGGLTVPLVSRSTDLLREADTREKGEIAKERKVDGNSWKRSRKKPPEIKTRQKMDKMVEQEWNIMEELFPNCFRKGHPVLQKGSSAWGWERSLQANRDTERQIQRSPTNTTSAATPLLGLEVTQEGEWGTNNR